MATNYNELVTEDDELVSIHNLFLTVLKGHEREGFVAGNGSTWDGLDGSSMANRLKWWNMGSYDRYGRQCLELYTY